MILVDTSVWINHLRAGEEELGALLNRGAVLCHPLVIGELAMGNLKNRAALLADLSHLPRAVAATDEEALGFLEHNRLYGLGIGYADVHLLAAARLSPCRLWTRDKRLEAVAESLALAYRP